MKRTIRVAIISLLLLISFPMYAQVKKLVSVINSNGTKETISFKYNKKSQVVYLDEKGLVTYREFTFKYDKATGQLTECTINEDRGELIQDIKYDYSNPGYINEEIRSRGKMRHTKTIETNKIYVDDKGLLTKTTFDDGKLWEEFSYDNNSNIITYTIHSAKGKNNTQTTYKYNTQNAVFLNIENLPVWFLALHLNNMKWIEGLIGKNMPIELTTDDPKYGIETIEVTYDYDTDGYPVKQYYDGTLVKEITYKQIK